MLWAGHLALVLARLCNAHIAYHEDKLLAAGHQDLVPAPVMTNKKQIILNNGH